MAILKSPGVDVTLINQSNYTSAPIGTVPFILLATAQDKLNQSNATAAYTTANTAGQVVLVGSQRELVSNFGAPTFYTSAGTPINGYELNEVGLLTAYSVLGVSDAAYVMRADIDLNALTGSVTPPSAAPVNGTIWFDTNTTSWGIFQWNATSQTFQLIQSSNTSGSGKLFVITDKSQTSDANFSVPIATLGKPGDFAVVTTNVNNPVWYQNSSGVWVEVGTAAWQNSLPAVIGNVVLSGASSVTGNLTLNGTNVTFKGANLTTVISDINAANILGVNAISVSSKVALTVNSLANAGAGNVTINGEATSNLGFTAGSTVNAPAFQASPNTNVPQWLATDTKPEPSGSVWFKTTSPLNGANFAVKVYNTVTGIFVSQSVPVAANDAAINYLLDPTAGGINIPSGSFYMEVGSVDFTLNLKERVAGNVVALGNVANPLFAIGDTFTLSTSQIGSATFTSPSTITVNGNTASDFVSAVNGANISGITASVTSANVVEIENTFGGTFILADGTGTPLANAGVTVGTVSNWITPTYTADSIAPTTDPIDGTLWYYDDPTQFDVMINDGAAWRGYRTVTSDARGYDLANTDPAGPIVSYLAPTKESNGNVLAYGDIWINTSDLDAGLTIYRYQPNGLALGVDGWVLIDSTDHESSNGIIFADARWATSGNVDPIAEPLPTISSLALSNYTDPDVPSYTLYPRGTLLFNTRRSALNVKRYTVNQFNVTNTVGPLPAVTSAWVSASGNDTSGVAYLGRHAQRQMVIKAMISAVNNSTQLAEETLIFNLLCAPGYPELNSTLEQLNVDRKETAFIVGDSPLRLKATANDLNNWASNAAGAAVDGDTGLVTSYDYLGVYYPAGLTSDLSGNNVVVPPSHMALVTMIQSDNQSFPWYAPAGTRRGSVINATSVGYIDVNGNFVPVALSQDLRDVLYGNQVNPIANLKGYGLTIYGQETRTTGTLMDRINVARLVVYVRQQLDQIGKQYVFEPNDAITRSQLANQITTLLNGLVTQRALVDFSVVCDTTNNTPATIDANELYCDVAIQPVTTAEFIYIPLTLSNNLTVIK